MDWDNAIQESPLVQLAPPPFTQFHPLDVLLRNCSEFNLCPRNYTNYPEQSDYTCTPGEFYPAAGIFDFNHANVNTGLVLKPMRSRQGQRDA